MTQNSNGDITMEILENEITLETLLDHLIINAIKEIRYSKKSAQIKTPSLSALEKLWKTQN